MAEEVSVQAKLIDLITGPAKTILELMGKVGELTDTELEAQKQALITLADIAGEYGVRASEIMEEIAEASRKPLEVTKEQKAAYVELEKELIEYLGYETDLNEIVAVLGRGNLASIESRQKALRILGEIVDEVGARHKTEMESSSEGFEALAGSAESAQGPITAVVTALASVASQAAVARGQIAALVAEMAKLRSKTIVITIVTVRKTVTAKASGSAQAGASAGGSASVGSNPYSDNGGSPTLSAAQAKVFTEQTILPALKILGREGKVEEIVR